MVGFLKGESELPARCGVNIEGNILHERIERQDAETRIDAIAGLAHADEIEDGPIVEDRQPGLCVAPDDPA